METYGNEPAVDEVPLASLQAQVTVGAQDDAAFESLARWWFVESRSRLCDPLWRRRERGDSVVDAVVGRIGVPSLGGGEWAVSYTPDRFDLLLASLRERSGDAFWRINAHPTQVALGDAATVHLSCNSEVEARPWALFVVSMTYRSQVDSVAPAESQRVLTDFVADFAERGSATFANIASDNSAGRTALETFLPRRRTVGMMESPLRARGYSWVTVISAEQVQRLGGMTVLEATGAFVEVRPLRYGGALLRATELFEDYDDEAMGRLFRVLAPVLPPGRPRKLPTYAGLPVPRLVYEDAAAHQPGAQSSPPPDE